MTEVMNRVKISWKMDQEDILISKEELETCKVWSEICLKKVKFREIVNRLQRRQPFCSKLFPTNTQTVDFVDNLFPS